MQDDQPSLPHDPLPPEQPDDDLPPPPEYRLANGGVAACSIEMWAAVYARDRGLGPEWAERAVHQDIGDGVLVLLPVPSSVVTILT